ncbi:signal peptidase II [Filimonas zeae]|uniref:Lipoprotein signal peptidase n=1 Tax=Filimonas zeae TaxID=1737353 RepID=A0A917MZN8_9BACT|nr:lipoprotein signal peptidase [Filimonas zeae]MDR6341293.1 signal peptidase II [Filimonas zeae]GGH76459.1 lipoprotein signal peptidase [Filimonas zeae]
MKGKQLALFIILILVADQALKLYIKTNYYIGEEHNVLGGWFRLHFVENEGMAWGWKFGGGLGKIILTLFRLVAVIVGTFYLRNIIRKEYHKGFIICAGLIYAGALGNLIDSMFYGLIFENSDPYVQNVAKMFPAGGGYASFLHGKVVDMLYFPIIRNVNYPTWFPFWGGEPFEFFRPVFNLADAAISAGVIAILIWQQKFFPQAKPDSTKKGPEEAPENIKRSSEPVL